MFSRLFTSAFLIAAALGLPACAETGFPDTFPATVSRLEIGQQQSEANAALQQLFRDDQNTDTKLLSLLTSAPYRTIKQRGFIQTADPFSDDVITLVMTGKAFEEHDKAPGEPSIHYENGSTATVMLSSPAGGEPVHVQGIIRLINFNPPMPRDAIEKRISRVYGEPHFKGENQTDYFWGFKDGDPIAATNVTDFLDQAGPCINPIETPRLVEFDGALLGIVTDVPGYLAGEDDTTKVMPDYSTCDAGAAIGIIPTPDDSGQVAGIALAFFDAAEMVADQAAWRSYVEKKVQEKAITMPNL